MVEIRPLSGIRRLSGIRPAVRDPVRAYRVRRYGGSGCYGARVLARYRELTARIDGFFDRVAARHGDQMRCGAGCDMCCRQRLTVTGVEAAAIEAWAAERSSQERATIAAAARATIAGTATAAAVATTAAAAVATTAAAAAAGDDRCAALDDAGRCRIYEARPLVCRSHGVPVRMTPARGLPVIESCALNFVERGPAAADADCILDQTLVSTMLGLIDREHAAATGRDAGERRNLADVLAGIETEAGA